MPEVEIVNTKSRKELLIPANLGSTTAYTKIDPSEGYYESLSTIMGDDLGPDHEQQVKAYLREAFQDQTGNLSSYLSNLSFDLTLNFGNFDCELMI